MTDIAILGVGAIGGTVAAYLSEKPPHRITLCARSIFSELIVETAEGRKSIAPRILNSPGRGEVMDWVIVATKAYDVTSTEPWLLGLVGPKTRVAILQNGVEHVALQRDNYGVRLSTIKLAYLDSRRVATRRLSF
ncbi:hypothetical protein HB777_22440 [Mesorhizobium loti]|nr:hypothetical protein HB777_22440 [Mesorhizobium loti]